MAFNQQPFYGVPQGFGGLNNGGYGYQQNPNPPKYTQTLSQEQVNRLRQNTDKFTLGLTQDEVDRGICIHRDPSNNQQTLRENPDNTVTCTICGYTFDPSQDMNEEDVRNATNGIIDILQTIKLLYLDMPDNAAREYFQIIPLLDKLPKLYELASDNFNRHEQWNNFRYNGSPNAINLYNMLNSGAFQAQQMQQPMGFGMGMQAPFMQQPVQQPMGYGMQPMGYPAQQPMNGQMMAGQPMQPTSNGLVNTNLATTQPQGYQAQTQGFQLNPGQQQPGAITPTSSTGTTDGKEVEVTSKFKA